MDKVAVIMSTFNGESYVLEQLRSLATQSYENVEVYIHDDGSTDTTNEIVDSFIQTNGSPIRFTRLKTVKYGYPQCFINPLLNIPQADYYAFCDQDDVWYPDKIKTALTAIKQYETPGLPCLFYSCVDYYDSNLCFIRKARFIEEPDTIKCYGLQPLLLGGEAMGMTYLFNNEVRNTLHTAYSRGEQHLKDLFIKVYCASCGTVIYSTIPCAKYRRHSKAVTAASNPSNRFSRYFGMAREIFLKKDGFLSLQTAIDYLHENMKEDILPEHQSLIELFSSPNSTKKMFHKLFWPERYRLRLVDEIGYRLAIFLKRI